jgi:Cu(I)/Ag(I) efflux system membrane protein CusA/SilA
MAHHARSQDALLTAVGGENVSTVKKAGERCPVNARYLRDFRSDLESLGRVLVPVTGDKQIPLSELSTIRTLTGPSMIRNEDGLLTEYVFDDVTDVPVGDAARSIAIGTWR